MSVTKLSVSALALVAVSATTAAARDEIRIVGSYTVFPYTQVVSEQFGNVSDFAAPIVESTGTGGGMKLFCGGVGEGHPDLTGASRAMKASEYKLCGENGVPDITEVQIGSDGLSIAVSRDTAYDWDMTKAQVYLGMAAEILVDGKLVANPNMKWSDVDANLPDVDVLAYGPFVEAGDYGISRPLFFYVKNAHRGVIPGLQEFIEEYVTEDSMGPGDYLSERGLVPLGDEARAQMHDAAINAVNMPAT